MSRNATIISMIRDLFETAESPITSKHLPAIAEQTGLNPTTVRLQYYRWRAESNSKAAKMARTGGTRAKKAA